MRMLILIGLGLASTLLAAPVDNRGSLADEIQHFVEPIETPAPLSNKLLSCPAKPYVALPTVDGVSLATIINMAEKVWTVIEKNQPVLDVRHNYANALPKGVSGAENLEGFSGVNYRSYRMYGKNLFGATVYDVTYTLVHRYGGRFQGKGRYLDGVTVLPTTVEALWGYKVSLTVDGVSTVNVGTNDDPIASIMMQMTFKVGTVIKKAEYRSVFEFRGNSPSVVAVN